METTIANLFNEEADAEVDFNLCKKWHPRFCFDNFSIPLWLAKYKIAHFHKHHQTLTAAVHKLYHVVLDNGTDRLQMSDALASGETFAIVCTNNDDNGSSEVMALAAITFAIIGSKSIVLFLAIDERY